MNNESTIQEARTLRQKWAHGEVETPHILDTMEDLILELEAARSQTDEENAASVATVYHGCPGNIRWGDDLRLAELPNETLLYTHSVSSRQAREAHRGLDDLGVARELDGEPVSLWMRILDLRMRIQSSAAPVDSQMTPVDDEQDSTVCIIWYEDADVAPEVVTSRKAAEKRFEMVSQSWNAHLFAKLKSNDRNDPYYNYNLNHAWKPASTADSASVDWPKLNEVIDDYIQGYEFRGDNGDYTPNERERFLMEDAIHGLIDEIKPYLTSDAPTGEDKNAFGVDARYFREKLRILLRDLQKQTHHELFRALSRLADVAGHYAQSEAAPTCEQGQPVTWITPENLAHLLDGGVVHTMMSREQDPDGRASVALYTPATLPHHERVPRQWRETLQKLRDFHQDVFSSNGGNLFLQDYGRANDAACEADQLLSETSGDD